MGFHDVGANGLRAALRYAQSLAAWNCGFEGARGGMYAVARDAFDAQIAALLAGELDHLADAVDEPKTGSLIDCPACSTTSPKHRVASHRVRRVAA